MNLSIGVTMHPLLSGASLLFDAVVIVFRGAEVEAVGIGNSLARMRNTIRQVEAEIDWLYQFLRSTKVPPACEMRAFSRLAPTLSSSATAGTLSDICKARRAVTVPWNVRSKFSGA